MTDVELEDNSEYSSFKAIIGVALPACILNAAAPLTAVVQAGLLGTHEGSVALGAFGAVSISAGFATRVFNFLVDGVSAKTGRSVGLRAWDQLSSRVKISLAFALVSGLLAATFLASIMRFVSVDILELSDEVLTEAAAYWWLRVGLVPILLVNMSLCGILQGFRHVRIAALINSVQAILEMGGSAVVLTNHVRIGKSEGLMAMGIVTVITQSLALVAGFVAILTIPPPEAEGQFCLWKDWFGPKIGLPSAPEAGEDGDKDRGLASPLLLGDEEMPEIILPRGRSSASFASLASMMSESERETLLDFVYDGMNMFVRSMILQTTFFVTLTAASRLGTAALAAYSVVSQLWSLISYGVDGFAAAGIVLGSRLAAKAHDPVHAADAKRHLQLLIIRVLIAGLLAGTGAAVVFAAKKSAIIALFTNDPATAAQICGKTWLLLTISQPINGLCFVYDGLMLASQNFVFIRNYIIVGFFVVFCPMIVTEMVYWKALWAVVASNAAVNIWRATGAAYLIHVIFMREVDSFQH